MDFKHLLVTVLLLAIVLSGRFDRSAAEQQHPSAAQRRDGDPVYEMFNNFMGQLQKNYGDPASFIPVPNGPYGPGVPFNPFIGGGSGGGPPFIPGSAGMPPFVGQPPTGGVSFGNYGNTVYPILNGMGYSGPYHGSGAGIPNPGYGNVGGVAGSAAAASAGVGGNSGNIPIVNTRVNTGNGLRGPGGFSSSVVKTSDGKQISVDVTSSPDGRPVFRSETVQGPNSYGTAFAYATR